MGGNQMVADRNLQPETFSRGSLADSTEGEGWVKDPCIDMLSYILDFDRLFLRLDLFNSINKSHLRNYDHPVFENKHHGRI